MDYKIYRTMRHIKIYEDYTDDELRDLLGDLHGVGHIKVDFDVVFNDYPEIEGDERKAADGWKSKSDPKVFLTSVSGEIGEEWTDLDFKFSNGDKANLDVYYKVGPHSYGTSKNRVSFTLNGREHKRVVDKYMEHLEYGGFVRAAMDIYDDLK